MSPAKVKQASKSKLATLTKPQLMKQATSRAQLMAEIKARALKFGSKYLRPYEATKIKLQMKGRCSVHGGSRCAGHL